jgi:hypothetical protein
MFPSSGEGGETPNLLEPLEKANLNPVIVDGNIEFPKRWVF